MREIEFRAKRISDGEWVHGNLFISDVDGKTHILCGSRRVTIEYEVEPETVGQYTGLKDKNGNKIFEGDIVRFEAYDDIGNEILYETFSIIWSNEYVSFLRKYRGAQDTELWIVQEKPEEYEVIGNIHDNPKLLEATP